ncbi:TPA: hypothetical protein ACP31I_004008 [Pseudomonas aeruginosa]|nr:hypothetical protein [Pseudomonas aeruginosa]HCE9880135.1 hypothetical protein [Pseudomonas aeruginosa]HCF0686206.1 hypothetical protein [Pseudomonas aeruginosa]HCF1202664.1 hypothetical protein [Pseudomonas aeruginosa]HEJ5008694.1 hypothetical protein [Pseudomonas aeruginosa]
MADLSKLIPPLPLRLRVMDFNARCESIHTQLNWEGQRTLLGSSDIAFAINAPLHYLADDDGADNVFFVDLSPRSRDLGRRGYQIVPGGHISSTEFPAWSEQVVRYVRHAALGCDWPGRNYTDFCQFLSYSQGRQLHFALADFDYASPLPLLHLPCHDFRTLYLLLIDNEMPDLHVLSELADVVEEMNPHLEAMVFGTAVLPDEPAKVMLLGETVTSLIR